MFEPTGRRAEYLTPGQFCPACGHTFEIAVTASGQPPAKGTLTVCMKCAQVSVFIDERNVTPLSEDMLLLLEEANPQLYRTLRKMQAKVRGE